MCNCGGGGGGGGYDSSFISRSNNSTPSNTDCDITLENLTTYKNMLLCIRNNNKYVQAKIAFTTVNMYMGIIQSALNYPDNYCYYMESIANFQSSILPLIVANVSECL